MDLGIQGKTAFVGGASRGLGKAIALALAAEGCQLYIYARSTEKLKATEASIRKLGAHVESITCDLSEQQDITKLCNTITTSKPEILINVPGGPPPATALGIDQQTWKKQAEVMLFNTIAITTAAVEQMQDRGWGRVLTITSSGVIEPIAQLAMSNTLRAGFTAWSKTLAGLVAAEGVTINTLIPGRIDTERVAELDAARATQNNQELTNIRTQAMASIPTGRYGRPEEFAATAAFLCSMQAGYITGSQIRVDGGMITAI